MRWIIPNQGSICLVLGNDQDSFTDKENMLRALECAAKAGELRGDLDKFRVLLASQIELEHELTDENPRIAYG